MEFSSREQFVFLVAVSLLPTVACAGANGYDPLAVADRHGSAPLDGWQRK